MPLVYIEPLSLQFWNTKLPTRSGTRNLFTILCKPCSQPRPLFIIFSLTESSGIHFFYVLRNAKCVLHFFFSYGDFCRRNTLPQLITPARERNCILPFRLQSMLANIRMQTPYLNHVCRGVWVQNRSVA